MLYRSLAQYAIDLYLDICFIYFLVVSWTVVQSKNEQ